MYNNYEDYHFLEESTSHWWYAQLFGGGDLVYHTVIYHIVRLIFLIYFPKKLITQTLDFIVVKHFFLK